MTGTGPAEQKAPHSMRMRLLTGATVWLFLSLLVVFAVLGLSVSQSLERTFQRQLGFEVDSLVAAIEVEDGNSISVEYEPPNPLFSRPYSGWYWQIRHGETVLRSRSLWDWDWDHLLQAPPPHNPSGTLHFRRMKDSWNRDIQVAERDVFLPGLTGVLHVTVGADRGEVTRERDSLLAVLAGALLLLFGLLLLTVHFLVSITLRPLYTLQSQLELMRSAPDKRLGGAQPRELAPLSKAFNAVLDHDADLISKARAHVGNLAHGLKTPLSILTTQAETLEPSRRDIILREVSIMRRLVDRHLSRARSVTGSATARGVQVAVCGVGRRLTSTMQALYPEGPRVRNSCDDAAVFIGDEDDLMEMLGNLLDNACKWAVSEVRLGATASESGGLVLSVEDDGPGLAQNEAERVKKRGARLDDTIAGHGLGLDIVGDLTSLYGGTLVLDRSFALGGLRAELRFPSMPPRSA